MSYANVEMKIIQWSEARKIIPNSTPEVQLLKAMSEMGELADATIKHDKEAVIDAVGDLANNIIFDPLTYVALPFQVRHSEWLEYLR